MGIIACTICVSLHFSAPRFEVDTTARRKWIQNIQAHQEFDSEEYGQIKICELHFDPRKISSGRLRNQLEKGTLPTIFPERKRYVTSDH